VPTDTAPPPSPLRAAIPRFPWLWLCAFIIACGWDRAIYLAAQATSAPTIEALEQLTPRQALALSYSWDLGDVLILGQYLAYFTVKLFGTAYLAAAIAAVIILRSFVQPDPGRVRIALRRGVLIFLSVAAGGLLAEALKLVFRRQRPEFADGYYSFRFSDWFNASGLGLPSSHAAVAVAAAAALCVLFPARRWLWILLGGLCVVSRVAAGAHFLSDVVLGALVGLAAARAVIALDLRNNAGAPVPA
jgi:membrane-associated phospholipid phosphatase